MSADPAPAGLTVQALPGKLPGLFLANPDRTPLTVLGRDGEPFLRFSERGVEVNTSSRTHVEDRQARGDAGAGPPGTTPTFSLAAPKAATYQWLDSRLSYPAELPPEKVLGAGTPTVVKQWDVPIEVAGTAGSLSGQISWVPEQAAAAQARTAPVPQPEPVGRSLLPLVLVTAGGLVLLATAVLVRRRSPKA